MRASWGVDRHVAPLHRPSDWCVDSRVATSLHGGGQRTHGYRNLSKTLTQPARCGSLAPHVGAKNANWRSRKQLTEAESAPLETPHGLSRA